MNVVVTGAAGFIGFNFVKYLAARGIKTIAVDDLSYLDSRPEIGPELKATANYRLDRKDFLKCMAGAQAIQVLDQKGLTLTVMPNAVVHLGACTDTTELDEAYLKEMNIDYSKAVWNWCTKHKIPMVYASSAATYGAGEEGYVDDESQISKLKPLNPYGESKRLFDLWALEEEKAGRHPISWSGFKFFNVYGFGERHKGKMASVILHAFDQIKAGGDVKLFKSYKSEYKHGEQRRDFVWVGDLAQVLYFALTKPIPRGVFNLGTGRARTFVDLAKGVYKALGLTDNIQFVEMPEGLRERYQYFTEADMKRLRAAGYAAPFASLEAGIHSTVSELSEKFSSKA